MSESLTGQKLGAYRVGVMIGEGAMGEVYRGVHEELGRRVAIKTLKRSLGLDADLMSRFFAEAKAVNIISHENIVECTDLVHDPNGRSYIVMELLEGRTLGAAIRAGRIAPVDAVHIAAQIADAIGAAHDKGIVHRDLKPENVFLIERAGQSDYVKVLDFGIARLQGLASTAAGALIGTPAYMSPEQASGERAVPASDIYALGVILFQLVTNRVPLSADTLPEMLAAHISRKPPRADTIAPEVPVALADAIDQALAKTADARPDCMHTFRVSILRAVNLPVRPSGRVTPLSLALEKTSAQSLDVVAKTAAAASPSIGNTSLSSAAGEASLQIRDTRVTPRRPRWLAIAAALVVVVGVGALWKLQSGSGSSFEELVLVGCRTSADAIGEQQLACNIEIAPELADDPEARPWIAYVELTPKDDVTLSDDRGCGRIATFPVTSGGKTTSVRRLVVTDCLLAGPTAHGYRTRLSASKDGTARYATLELTVSTPAAQHNQGYKTLLSSRSYSLADVWFLDSEKRAEEVVASDPEAPQIIVRSIYYRAFTRYMRLVDCSMLHRVEGKACGRADMDRWYTEAIAILENPLALALLRPIVSPKVLKRTQADRMRLNNELVLRFSKGKIGVGSSVYRNLGVPTKLCTDFRQQSRGFLALIAATGGQGDAAIEHLVAMLANLTELPAECANDASDRDSLARGVNAILLAEYGVCSGQPVLKDVTAFVCGVMHQFPQLPRNEKITEACKSAKPDPDEDLSRAIRLLVINMRRREAGLPWRGGCHQKRLFARAPAGLTGTAMGGDPTALVVEIAPVAADDSSWHYVIDAEGHVHERRPLNLKGTFKSCAVHRTLGIAVAPESPLAAAIAEEMVDELRERYAITESRVSTAAHRTSCDQ